MKNTSAWAGATTTVASVDENELVISTSTRYISADLKWVGDPSICSVGAVIMLSAALTLQYLLDRRQVVVGALLPAFAVGRVALNLLKYTSGE